MKTPEERLELSNRERLFAGVLSYLPLALLAAMKQAHPDCSKATVELFLDQNRVTTSYDLREQA